MFPSSSASVDAEILQMLFLNLVYAITCGAIIGAERGFKKKSAGIKTHILICVGAMIFTFMAVLVARTDKTIDVTRVIGQIVSGIGFLGAGAILRSADDKIHGLTTAAIIWVTSAIGAFVGLGYGPIAVVVTAVIVPIVAVSLWFEETFIRKD